MKLEKNYLVGSLVGSLMISASAVDHTWTGTAADGDWNNAANWDANGIPVDDRAGLVGENGEGLTLNSSDTVTFSGTNMPTLNVPGYGGDFNSSNSGNSGNSSSPTMLFNRGGSISFTNVGRDDSFWTNLNGYDRTLLTVGDGVTGAGEEVTVTISGTGRMNRHGDGTVRIVVNEDGTLIMDSNLSRWGNSSARLAIIAIDGGVVDFNDDIPDVFFNDGAINFLSIGGSFSADFGGAFPDTNAVIAALGAQFVNSTGEGLLEVTDDGTSFTVTAVVAPDPNYWTGTGGGSWDQNTTVNFTTSGEADALVEDTFGNATASSNRATFADQYFDAGVALAVTQSSITIPTGGVTAGFVDFLNSSVSYSVTSSDANGIATATSVSVNGGGSVSLLGTHAYSGGTSVIAGSTLTLDNVPDVSLPNSTISNTGTLVIDLATDESQDGSFITGLGTVEKQGAGTLTLLTGNVGPVVVTEGTVVVNDTFSNPSFDIAASATLELNIENFTNAPNSSFTGTGTLRKTGFEQVRWASQIGTFELGSGSLIDVQEGTFRAGSNANEDWTNNFSDLNVASGATFNTHEANVRVDAITGDGTIGSAFDGGGYVDFTFGVDNGTGTYTGAIIDQTAPANITKIGTGTQTLDGPNSYTGNTTVEDGVLNLGFDNVTVFVPTSNGVTNQITGTTGSGTVNLNGIIDIDLSGATAAPGNSWTLIDPSNLTVNYQNDFLVDSSLGNFQSDNMGVWTLVSGIGSWSFDQATGVLSFIVGDDARLWTGINGGIWDAMTTANFSDNIPSDPVDNVTFDVAAASSGSVSFTDEYFSNGIGVGVTNSTIMIAAGGVETTTVNFFNSSLAYTFESSDALGITGITNLVAANTGPLTFRGDHSNTGSTTISGGSTLTFDAADQEAWNYTSALENEGNLEKTGLGSYTLAGGAANTGTTAVTAGELVVQAQSHSATAVSIASGATLTYETTGGNPRIGVDGTYSGDGVLQKTGVGGMNFNDATFAFSAAALVDVQEGTMSGGSSINEDWSANLSDMNIAAGAIFTTVEANVFIDTVSGDGTLRTGFGGAGYSQLTIGVADGDATFSGLVEDHSVAAGHLGGIAKVGAGTQTFTGASTLHENYTVEEGTLIFGSTASVTFYPTANGTSNQLLGGGVATGTVNVDGAINVDLSATDATFGNSWLLIDDTAVTVVPGATLTVTSTAGAFTQDSPGVWTLDAAGNLWTFTVATGTLDVSVGTAASGFGSFQTTFFTPAEITAGDADAGVDFDGGSLSNGIEFVVGGDPTDGSDDTALAPTFESVAGGFLFTFRRTDDSAGDNPGVEYDTDLAGVFTPAVDGTDGVTVTVTDDGFEAGVDQVDVFLPDSLAVDGKLFARLAVTPAL